MIQTTAACLRQDKYKNEYNILLRQASRILKYLSTNILQIIDVFFMKYGVFFTAAISIRGSALL